MDQNTNRFDEWGVVELMGHQKIAGHITEASIGGGAFLRVDVPDQNGEIRFTRYFSPGSVYSINPCDKQIAIAMALKCTSEPVHRYQIAHLVDTEEDEQEDLFE